MHSLSKVGFSVLGSSDVFRLCLQDMLKSAQWSYKFVKHAFKVEKLLFIQATSTFTTYKALFGEHGTSVQT